MCVQFSSFFLFLLNLNIPLQYNQAGDMSSLRLNNRVYNSFRRQVQHLKVLDLSQLYFNKFKSCHCLETRADRKNMGGGGRRTRASFAKTVSGDAVAAIAERSNEVGPNLAPGAPCMAFSSADRLWYKQFLLL